MHARAFDELAAEYDTTFTDSVIGRTLRGIVWSRLDAIFHAPQRILELGCGTGEDATRLAREGFEVVAVDASPRMIHLARQKAAGQGLSGRLEFRCLPMEDLQATFDGQSFDGVLSNFGAINCVPNLPALIAAVAAHLAPQAPLVWIVMGRYAPWEWLWYLRRGDWAKAWRRLNRRGVAWRGLNISYPTPGELKTLLRPHFAIVRVAPLGFALPPSYAAAWLSRWPRLLKALIRLEMAAQRWSTLASWSDHYIVEATRLPASVQP